MQQFQGLKLGTPAVSKIKYAHEMSSGKDNTPVFLLFGLRKLDSSRAFIYPGTSPTPMGPDSD